jgi:hypothetical protein
VSDTQDLQIDLGAIEGRHQAAISTGNLMIALHSKIGGAVAMQQAAEAVARSAADVPNLIQEIKRLRRAVQDARVPCDQP